VTEIVSTSRTFYVY